MPARNPRRAIERCRFHNALQPCLECREPVAPVSWGMCLLGIGFLIAVYAGAILI